MLPSFRTVAIILAAFFLVFLAIDSSPPAPAAAAIDPAQLPFIPLCDAYRQQRTDKLLAELRTRHEFPPQEFDDVAAGRITVGMSWAGLVCARGLPDSKQSTTTSDGVTDWYAYTSPRLLVRLDGGKVYSFSD